MQDSILDDAKALLDKELGDKRILEQICRAVENNEVISNFERNYVRKLVEKHLGQPTPIETPFVEETPAISDVIIPETSTQKIETIPLEPYKITQTRPKNTKKILGIGGIILALIVVIAISVNGISNIPTEKEIDSTPIVSNPPSPTLLSLQTDLLIYQKGDIISISGRSGTSETVTLSIENQNNVLVWTEQVVVKNDGSFSTLAIAGGAGWEKSGIFTIKIDNNSETKSKTFSFKI